MATERGGKIVVKTTLSFENHKGGRMVAAHLRTLGLTAYGYTTEDARSNVMGLVPKWINLLRQLGILERRLDDMGVEWWRFDDYDGSLPVEDTTADAPASVDSCPAPVGEVTPMAVAA